MEIIPVEQKGKVLACFRQKPVPSFTEISKQTGVHRVTIYHWFEQFEEGGLRWSEGGAQDFQALSEAGKGSSGTSLPGGGSYRRFLDCSYGLRSEPTVPNRVRDYKKATGAGTPLVKRKGGKRHMGHRDTEPMADRGIRIENVFLHAYLDERSRQV